MRAVHALGPELIADKDTKFVLAQTAEPRGFDSQLGKTYGHIALRACGADPVAVYIAQRPLGVGGEGCHRLSNGE